MIKCQNSAPTRSGHWFTFFDWSAFFVNVFVWKLSPNFPGAPGGSWGSLSYLEVTRVGPSRGLILRMGARPQNGVKLWSKPAPQSAQLLSVVPRVPQ